MSQVYKKEEYIIVPVCNNFIVINIEKQFKYGHTHLKNFNTAKLIIDLAIKKQLPKNYMLVNNLVRLTEDQEYKKKLIEFKDESTLDFSRLMQEGHTYRRSRGAWKQNR
ncbi:hypothetical protein [Clostridium botulinum]|uniref:hypothetical protein n=1 Tax=Clostridium botulinum TaxID=1491 RepID=UPI001E464CC0|nr:hypothetical protein [Clostridium botulinum]